MAYIGPAPNPGQNREVDDISSGFNGGTASFTLQVNGQNVSPGSSNAIIVSLGGVVQNPGTDYTVAGSTITFTTNPASGLSFFGLVLGQQVDTEGTADASVTAAKLASPLDLPDNQKIRFGTGNDLSIYHDGSHSYIEDSGTGNLRILTSSVFTVNNAANSANMILATDGGSVNLFHNGSQKFFTNTAGTTIESTGNTPTLEFRGASNLDLGKIEVDQFVSNNSLMKFSTLSSGTQGEVLRLLDNKQILLSKTTNSSISQSGIVISANGNCQFSHVGTSDHDFLEFNRGTDGSMNRIGLIRTSGSGTIYNTTSDYRLKENAVAISDGITRLKTLKPYRFNFKIEPDKTVDGFFAHEVTAVPEAITGTKDEVDENNKPVYQGIDQSKLVPLLTAALQEAIAKIETLETKVAALEAA